MSQVTQKDYYKILGIDPTASQQQIEDAYQKLAAENHPQKHPEDRVKAQQIFNEICQAYFNLCNPERRSHYDELRTKKFDTETAAKTFQKFFDEHGFNEEEEKQFFDKYYPEKKKNYYQILGLKKNASIQEINNAYRKLAIKYHPKNNQDKDAEQKFIAVNQAYYTLSNKHKRKQYDQHMFHEFQPKKSHSIFEDFFGKKPFLLENDKQFFSPFLKRPILNLIEIEPEPQYFIKPYMQTPKSVTGKSVIQKTEYKNGKKKYTKTEEILNNDGTKQVTVTVDDGNHVRTKKYNLGVGQERPIYLELL